MLPFEKLDAWKACHALVLATFQATEECFKKDPQIARRLQYTAMRAGGKLAFGSGTRNRRMFRLAVARVSGYLAEFAYQLSLARVIGLIPDKTCDQLHALRGRAAFYSLQLLQSLLSPPRRGRGDRSEG